MKISVIKSDITKLDVDTIVSAANSSLLGGGGVDGAIHRAAGPDLLAECRTLGGCPAGEARITKGYNLKAKYVIHTVGPVWHGGRSGEPQLFENCYISSMRLAEQYSIKKIAFPNISTGIYGYPKELAAKIVFGFFRNYSKENSSVEEVILCCFDDENFDIYNSLKDTL